MEEEDNDDLLLRPPSEKEGRPRELPDVFPCPYLRHLRLVDFVETYIKRCVICVPSETLRRPYRPHLVKSTTNPRRSRCETNASSLAAPRKDKTPPPAAPEEPHIYDTVNEGAEPDKFDTHFVGKPTDDRRNAVARIDAKPSALLLS